MCDEAVPARVQDSTVPCRSWFLSQHLAAWYRPPRVADALVAAAADDDDDDDDDYHYVSCDQT